MRLLLLIALVALSGCRVFGPDVDSSLSVTLEVPGSFEPVPFPSHNPWSEAKTRLGRRLFFDTRLSGDGTVSCASCHEPDLAFADGLPVSVGVGGRMVIRNSPGLVNIAYETLFFRDGGVFTLEAQALAPLESPLEMDMDLGRLVTFLKEDAEYAAAFETAFGTEPSLGNLTQALATYQRTIRTGGSRYDDYLAGRTDALTASERRGLQLFEENTCTTCHNGFLLTNHAFENNGTAIAPADSGRARITGLAEDYGRFKVPSLRNVARTAPYMHDGSLATLADVLRQYRDGGTGVRNQHPAIRPLPLTDADLRDLEAFLRALDDTITLEGPQHD